MFDAYEHPGNNKKVDSNFTYFVIEHKVQKTPAQFSQYRLQLAQEFFSQKEHATGTSLLTCTQLRHLNSCSTGTLLFISSLSF